MPKKKKRKAKITRIEGLILGLGAILAAVLIVNILQTEGLGREVEKAKETAKEMSKPAQIQLITILDSNCGGCFDAPSVVSRIEKGRVNITEKKTLEFDSETTKKLIEKYNIEKIPTVLVSGEIDKLNKNGFREKEGVLIFEEVLPPYVKADDGEIKGLVSVTYLEESSCEVCPDLKELFQFEKAGIKIVKEEKVEINSEKGQELVKEYGIDKVPTVLFSEDIQVYAKVSEVWDEIGSIEEDGSYVLRLIRAPYFDVEEGRVAGLVGLTMITDELCGECYDVRLHKQLLEGLGMAIKGEETVDINSAEGIKLRVKYKLKKVPTVILAGDMEAYEGLNQVWQQVGTVEEDGSYVFRELELLGVPYKDLTTNKLAGAGT